MSLLERTDRGLYCRAGGFFIDPWRPVDRAVVTHAHSDHAVRGCGRYLIAEDGLAVARIRLGEKAQLDAIPFGKALDVDGVSVSLHPAGHILGSAQVRVEHGGEVWVVSGDYKVDPDATCAGFEPVPCRVFISESTFGLPIYRWAPQSEVFAEINAWWRSNLGRGACTLLLGYSLGKAQRLLAGLDPSIGPIYTHEAVEPLVRAYRESGIALPATVPVEEAPEATDWSRALVLAPPSVQGTPWLRRFGELSSGMASGWMATRSGRGRSPVDRGFVLSDHADWPGLLGAIAATGAERILLTHGYSAALARWLREGGADAGVLETEFGGEAGMAEDPEGAP